MKIWVTRTLENKDGGKRLHDFSGLTPQQIACKVSVEWQVWFVFILDPPTECSLQSYLALPAVTVLSWRHTGFAETGESCIADAHGRQGRQWAATEGARSPKMAMGVNKRDNSGQSDCGRLRKAIKLP